MNLTLKELDRKVAEKTGYSVVSSKKIRQALFASIAEAMLGGADVTITRFGKFTPKKRKPRKFCNFSTKQFLIMPEHTMPSFRASSGLKKQFREKSTK